LVAANVGTTAQGQNNAYFLKVKEISNEFKWTNNRRTQRLPWGIPWIAKNHP